MLSLRLAGLVVVALAFVPGCQLLIPESCPDLDEVCPDVQCEDRGGYVQNRDGCSTCECVDDQEPEPGAICWDNSECADGQRCDTVNFCEQAPNCDPEGPCPDACYGRCVEASAACNSDADCGEGQICAFFTNERPAEERPDDGGGEGGTDPDAPGEPGAPEPAPVPVESGVCIDVSCGNTDVALPECPPGSELVFDPSIDPCNAVCVSVDFCRELQPEECLAFPGCELLEEPCGCSSEPSPDGQEPEPCDCAFIERCVAVDDCGSLPLEECELNPACVLKAVGGGDVEEGGGNGGDGAQPAPCDPDAPDCQGEDPVAPPPPEEQLVCVARGADGTCFSDADCSLGEVCQLVTVCGSGCQVNADGSEDCFEECWTEQGTCVASDRSCFDLLPDACLADPRCELVDGGAAPCFCDDADPNCGGCEDVPSQFCQPRQTQCFDDFECAEGQHCELIESCPACDPSTGDDIDCLAPCFVEGRCVDGAPPPVSCGSDTDCLAGETCVAITVCETCDGGGAAPGDGEADPIAPPPCDPECRDDAVCVQTQPLCFSDADCGGGFCDFSQLDCGAQPGGLVAQCPGVCVDVITPCQTDEECGAGQRCAVELEAPVCVDDNTTGGGLCSSDDECAADNGSFGGSCRFSSSFCLDDPSTDVVECLGWCANACAEVETPAVDPASGICEVFPDSCIPPGWERAEGC
jgi:hypothetical protein